MTTKEPKRYKAYIVEHNAAFRADLTEYESKVYDVLQADATAARDASMPRSEGLTWQELLTAVGVGTPGELARAIVRLDGRGIMVRDGAAGQAKARDMRTSWARGYRLNREAQQALSTAWQWAFKETIDNPSPLLDEETARSRADLRNSPNHPTVVRKLTIGAWEDPA